VSDLLGELGESLGRGTECDGLASLVEELHEHLLGGLAILALGLDLGVQLLAHVLQDTHDVGLGLGTDGTLLLDGVVNLVDVSEKLLDESLLVSLTLLLLGLELVLELVHGDLEASHGVLGILLALLLLLCHLELHNESLLFEGLREDSVELNAALALLKESILNITELLVHLRVDAVLARETVLALGVQGLGDAKNLISDLLLAALLGLVATFLLACEVLTEVDTGLVDLLDDLGLELLALLALLVDLDGHASLKVLNIVVQLGVKELELVTLGSDVEAKALDQDVKWLEALILGTLVAHDLLIDGTALQLHHGGASLLLGLEVVMGGLHARSELVQAGVSRRHSKGSDRHD